MPVAFANVEADGAGPPAAPEVLSRSSTSRSRGLSESLRSGAKTLSKRVRGLFSSSSSLDANDIDVRLGVHTMSMSAEPLGLQDGVDTFDSPLQTSIGLLRKLEDHLLERSLESEAGVVQHVVKLLHSDDLFNTETLDELVAEGKIETDDTTKEWLQAMEWMKKPQESNTQLNLSSRQSSRISRMGGSGDNLLAGQSSFVFRSGRISAEEEEDEQEDLELRRRLLSPWLHTKVVDGAEALVLDMLENDLSSWSFNTLKLHELTGGHALAAVGWAIAEKHGLRDEIKISQATLQNFLLKAEEGYRQVPYHNAAHAACVTHGVFHLMTERQALSELFGSPLDLFTAVLAAIVHDLGHTGHNNAFHVATQSDLAILYSDQSVLEMHHLANAFQLLKHRDCQLLKHLSDDAKKEVRSRIVGMILATDLAVNFPTINAFKQMLADKSAEIRVSEVDAAAAEEREASMPDSHRSLERANSANPSAEKSARGSGGGGTPARRRSIKFRDALASAAPRLPSGGGGGGVISVNATEELMILKMILKASDIGNVTKGRTICLGWTERVVAEFFAQGDLEAELNLPVTPFMDRNSAVIPKQQIGFYNFIAKPMFEALDGFIDMTGPLSNLESMYEHWSSQIPTETPLPVVRVSTREAPRS